MYRYWERSIPQKDSQVVPRQQEVVWNKSGIPILPSLVFCRGKPAGGGAIPGGHSPTRRGGDVPAVQLADRRRECPLPQEHLRPAVLLKGHHTGESRGLDGDLRLPATGLHDGLLDRAVGRRGSSVRVSGDAERAADGGGAGPQPLLAGLLHGWGEVEPARFADERGVLQAGARGGRGRGGAGRMLDAKHDSLLMTDKLVTIYHAWNIAIRAARTEFVTNANSDDRLAVDGIARLGDYLDKVAEGGS